MTLVQGTVVIDHQLCSTCSQCIAVCPERALRWRDAEARQRQPERLPSPQQLDELFKERRSTRRFAQAKIPRSELEAIVACAAYAPTNNYDFRVILVDEPKVLNALEVYARSMVSRLYRVVFKHRVLFEIFRRFPLAPHTGPKDRVKVEGNILHGHTIFHEAAAMLFIVGDARVALSSDSAQYALANVVFAAQVRGIASCLSGAAKTLLGFHPAARRMLGLLRRERIYGVLTLGYPAVAFHNNVEGKRLPVAWVEAMGSDRSRT